MEFCTDWTSTLRTRRINIKNPGQHYILFADNLPENWYLKEDDAFREHRQSSWNFRLCPTLTSKAKNSY